MQTLYRHYDKRGELLYVGISINAFTRLSSHLRKSHWSRSIRTMTIDYYDTRKEVRAAERAAIEREKPKHNILMNGKKRRVKSKRGFSWFGLALVAVILCTAYLYVRHPALFGFVQPLWNLATELVK